MVMQNYSTLNLLVFHGIGKDDVEQDWFTCESIWEVKQNEWCSQDYEIVHEV